MKYPLDPSFPITQSFQDHENARIKNGWQYYNGGVDWACPEGTILVSPVTGRVVFVGPDAQGVNKGYGYHVRIEEKDTGRLIILAHLTKALVRQGEAVEAEQQVALSGNTGYSTGPHLHFEVRTKEGAPIDPLPIIENPVLHKGKVVAKWGVNVRSGPATSFAKIGNRVCGAQLEITKVCGNWAKLYGEKWVCITDGSEVFVQLDTDLPAKPVSISLEEKVNRLWAAHPELWSDANGATK